MQRRIRAWALGSRRTVGLPAVFDAESQQYFLLIRAAEGSEDCSLVSFSDDSSVKLDEAPKLSVFSSALATFPATAAGSRGTGGSSSGGGVLVVLRKGGLRWLRPDGTDQCPCQNGSESARAVAAAAIHGGDGAAIVAVARAEQGKEGAAQSIDLYIAGAGQMQQLRHSASATLDASAGVPSTAHVHSALPMPPSSALKRSSHSCGSRLWLSLSSAGPVASVVPLDATSVAVLFADGSLRVFRNGGGARSASGAAALAQARHSCQLSFSPVPLSPLFPPPLSPLQSQQPFPRSARPPTALLCVITLPHVQRDCLRRSPPASSAVSWQLLPQAIQSSALRSERRQTRVKR